ncbi:MAG TPA: hypothetical protein VMR08_01635 [Patescibacteria group bacterium]|nr:hypothetical protein [Patescibacteria group bacterium]
MRSIRDGLPTMPGYSVSTGLAGTDQRLLKAGQIQWLSGYSPTLTRHIPFMASAGWLGLWSDLRTISLTIDPSSMARVKALLV